MKNSNDNNKKSRKKYPSTWFDWLVNYIAEPVKKL